MKTEVQEELTLRRNHPVSPFGIRLFALFIAALLFHACTWFFLVPVVEDDAVWIVATVMLAWIPGLLSQAILGIESGRGRTVVYLSSLIGAVVALSPLLFIVVDESGYLVLYWMFFSWGAFIVMVLITGTMVLRQERDN